MLPIWFFFRRVCLYIENMTQPLGELTTYVRVATAISNGQKRVTITAKPGYSELDWKIALATAGVSDDYDDWDYFEPDGSDLMIWMFTLPAQA